MSNLRTKTQLYVLDNLIWVLIVLLFVVDAFVVPKFFTYNNILNIFYHVAALGVLILAQGFVLLVGQLDLSIESVMAFAPGMAILVSRAFFPDLNPFVQILLTLGVGAVVGIFNGTLITLLKMNSLLETLAANIILRGFVLLLLPFSIMNLKPWYIFWGSARILWNIPVAILVMIGLFALFSILLSQFRFGRFLIATGGNPKASNIAGVNVNRMSILAYMIAGLLAAVAGLLAAGRQSSISNTLGNGFGIMSIAGAILGGVSLSGGRGTVSGMLGGALLLSLFDNFLNLLAVNVYWVSIIKGSLILFAIVLDSVKVRARNYILNQERLRQMRGSISSP
jgi:simple sugar transport system permease protein/ribose transport system permease protein